LLHDLYRLEGFPVLRELYHAAFQAHDRARDAFDNEELGIAAELLDIDHAVEEAQQRIGDVGDQSGNREQLSQKLLERMLRGPSASFKREKIRQERIRRQAQIDVLQDVIEDIALAEEEAQRWYEKKLLETVRLDCKRWLGNLAKDWKRYSISDAKTGIPVVFDDKREAEAFTLLAKDDLATVTVGRPAKSGEGGEIQGISEEIQEPAVLVAVHELAKTDFEYREALSARRASAKKLRPVDGQSVPAWTALKAYRDAIMKWAGRHAIAIPAHRGLYRVSKDKIYDRKRLEKAVIGAFIKSRDTLPEIQQKLFSNRIFEKDEAVAPTRSADGMTRQAVDALIEEKFQRRQGAPPGLEDKEQKKKKAEDVKDIDIRYCPWLHQPFHARLQAFAEDIRKEEAAAAAKKINASFANPAQQPAEKGAKVADETLWPPVTDPVLYAEVAHLSPLFADAEDRRRLLWITSIGTFSGRARQETIQILQYLFEQDAKFRSTARWVVTGAGLAGAYFTAGKSLVLAGIINAALVADQSIEDIETWLAARQFSRLALDRLSAKHWQEPEVAEMMSMILEAGFDIASEVITAGPAGRLLDAIGVAILLVSLKDPALMLLEEAQK